MLDIRKEINGGELFIALEGKLDTVTAPELEKEMKESIESADKLVWDLKKLEYISSAGLRVLLSAQKIMNRKGDMIVKDPSEEVMEIFEVTGFSDILTISK